MENWYKAYIHECDVTCRDCGEEFDCMTSIVLYSFDSLRNGIVVCEPCFKALSETDTQTRCAVCGDWMLMRDTYSLIDIHGAEFKGCADCLVM